MSCLLGLALGGSATNMVNFFFSLEGLQLVAKNIFFSIVSRKTTSLSFSGNLNNFVSESRNCDISWKYSTNGANLLQTSAVSGFR